MATTIYLRTTRSVPNAYPAASYQDLTTAIPSAGLTMQTDGAATGTAERPLMLSSSPMAGWSERVSAQVTISGTITVQIRTFAINAGFTGRILARVFKVTAGGSNVETLIAEGQMAADAAASTTYTFTLTPPTAVVVAPNERFILRLVAIPSVTTGDFGPAGGWIQVISNTPSANYTSVQFTETVTFKVNGVTLITRRTNDSGITGMFDLLTARGVSNFATAIVNTVAGGTQVQWTQTAGGALLAFASPRLKAPGWTPASASYFATSRISASESNASANAGYRAELSRRKPDGSETVIAAWTGTTELTVGAVVGFNLNTSIITFPNGAVPCAEDDRLILRYFIINIGTMASGFTASLGYDHGTAGVTGDSTIVLNDSPEFKAEGDPAGTSSIPSGLAMGGVGN